MARPILATISTTAMAHNLAQVQERAKTFREASTLKTLAIIKANAYGHGTLNALKGFAKADGLGMIDLSDAVLCRESAWKKPIFLLEGFFHQEDVELLNHYQISTALHSFYQIEALEKASNTPIDVMVKINTGMNRLGFSPEMATTVMERLRALQTQGKVGRIGVMSHFANADLDREAIEPAMACITPLLSLGDGDVSLCNSAASIRYPELSLHGKTHYLRPGISLYGSTPFTTELTAFPSLSFQATMTLSANVIAIQSLKKGESVGYGSTFTADREMTIAVLACGYADGYPRSATQGTPVSVQGHAASVVGRVSMDMLTIDITHLPWVQIGTPVVLWGEGGPSIDTVAEYSGRIGYELMCGLTKRVPVQVI